MTKKSLTPILCIIKLAEFKYKQMDKMDQIINNAIVIINATGILLSLLLVVLVVKAKRPGLIMTR